MVHRQLLPCHGCPLLLNILRFRDLKDPQTRIRPRRHHLLLLRRRLHRLGLC